MVVQVKALACELPANLGLPLSRMSIADVAREVRRAGIVARISDKTVWRWLHEDAIRPWQHRCWIFPRDPDFRVKAGRILDLYEGHWNGIPLRDDEFVISTDEKTSIQARQRTHGSLPTAPRQAMRIEHEYVRQGAWAYLAAWDVRRAKIHGSANTRPHRTIRPPPATSDDARTLSLRSSGVLDHGQRLLPPRPSLCRSYQGAMADHRSGPHARACQLAESSEIYFSILQRKALTPNDFPSSKPSRSGCLASPVTTKPLPNPFEWKFTRKDLDSLLQRIDRAHTREQPLLAAA